MIRKYFETIIAAIHVMNAMVCTAIFNSKLNTICSQNIFSMFVSLKIILILLTLYLELKEEHRYLFSRFVLLLYNENNIHKTENKEV